MSSRPISRRAFSKDAMLASDSSLSRQVFKTSAAHSSVEAELEERNSY